MDRSEFERMAPRLRERIVSMVVGMSAEADSDMADDVAQDTLLKLWMMRDKLDRRVADRFGGNRRSDGDHRLAPVGAAGGHQDEAH